MADIRIAVDNTIARIVTPIPDTLIKSIADACAFRIQGAEHSALYRARKWDGYKRLYKARYSTFPAGLLNMVVGMLGRFGYSVEIEDNTTKWQLGEPLPLSPSLEPRWYQFSAAASAIEAKRSIVKLATGGGKTPIACIITAQLNLPTLFLVHTKDLLRQAKEAYNEFLGIEVGQIGDGIVDIRPISVGTIQTIARTLGTHYKKDTYSEEDESDDTDVSSAQAEITRYINDIGLLIQDEVHRVASDSAFEVSSLIKKAEYRVGFSASPWRDDGADLMIEAAFGHKSFDMSASQLIKIGYLMAPTIKIREISGNPFPMGTYDQIYKDWVVEDVRHNLQVVNDVSELYNENRLTLVLVKHIRHGEVLSHMLDGAGVTHQFLKGNDSSTVRGDAIRDMRNRQLRCIIATSIADEGLDIKPLDSVVLAGRGKSSVRALQRVGRILRPYDKPAPIVIEYHDRTRFLEDHALRRLRIYQTEPEFIIER